MHSRDNSFDILRHFAAFLVMYSHYFALSGKTEPTVPHWDTYGFVAVAIFFAISGYFMPQSHASAGNFVAFMSKRCRRIFPGLIVCSFITVYIIGGIFTASSVYDYYTGQEQFQTFFMYCTFIGRTIPTVFSDFIYKNAIHGSLWTLPVEFISYIIIGSVLSFSHSVKSMIFLFWLACISTATLTYTHFDYAFYGVPISYLSLFGVAFTTGALLSMTKDSWLSAKRQMFYISILILWLLRGRPEIQVLGTASIAVIVVIIGISFKDKIIKGRFDISYGIYIYAFPIQQIVINRVTEHFWVGMLLSAVLTIFVAFLSYRYVELPFLKKRWQKDTAIA